MQTAAPFSCKIAGPDVEAAVELHVFLACESLSAALGAADALALLIRRDPEGLIVRLSPWSFAALENPRCRALVEPDVEKAALIVLASCNATQRLSAGVEHWLKLCLARRRDASSIVAALFEQGDNADGPDSPRLESVRRLAQEAGWAFFAPKAADEIAYVL